MPRKTGTASRRAGLVHFNEDGLLSGPWVWGLCYGVAGPSPAGLRRAFFTGLDPLSSSVNLPIGAV